MARITYVLRDGELVDKRFAPPLHGSGHTGPFVQSDVMDPIRSMADGRMYDSKSEYRRGLKARGCIEVGNERAPFDRRPEFVSRGVGDSIKRAIEQLESR
jgi:hypothetical protein